MKILLVHNRYQQPGGEDAVFELENDLLIANGHDCHVIDVSNKDIFNAYQRFRAGLSAIYSRKSKALVSEAIRSLRPDIVHVHNFFPMLSPSVYDACRDWGVPVVQTLHNYRLACPGAKLYRAGKVCEDCLGTSFALPAILHGCYRSSRLQTTSVATMLFVHRVRDTWARNVDRYIALTAFQRNKMIEAGLPGDKITVKPNFTFDPPKRPNREANYLLFVGRLSEEKGIEVIVEAYRQHNLTIPLVIVGDGPLFQKIHKSINESSLSSVITLLGHKNKEDVLALMQNASALLFPSTWFEGFPMTIVEAFASSTPVLASNIGGCSEIVSEENGWFAPPGDPLAWANEIKSLWSDPSAIRSKGNAARLSYETKYTADRNYHQLVAIYDSAISSYPNG